MTIIALYLLLKAKIATEEIMVILIFVTGCDLGICILLYNLAYILRCAGRVLR